MNIQTVADNLRNTIARKEVAYNEWRREQSTVGDFVCRMIDLNIAELKRILQDLEQCIPAPVPVKVKIDYAKALTMGRKDYAHSECPDDCRPCEHFKTCVYPIMDSE